MGGQLYPYCTPKYEHTRRLLLSPTPELIGGAVPVLASVVDIGNFRAVVVVCH
jgi:hypothetical protein